MPKPKLALWDNMPEDHAFYGHPILHWMGEDIDAAALREVRKHADHDAFGAAFSAYEAITRLERGHGDTLTDLARDVVESVWGIPPHQMKGGIGPVTRDVSGMDFEPEENIDVWDLEPEQLLEVQKRLLMNTIIQGCAIHAMLNNPRMVQADLNRIDGSLIRVYEEFSWNALATYWQMDYDHMGAREMAAQAAGYEDVRYENIDGEEMPVVYAKGVNFPVMLQEFVKGVTEIICINGLSSLDPDMQKIVVSVADRVEYEPHEIMLGPQIWRRLLRKVGRDDSPSQFLLSLATMQPEQLMGFTAGALQEE